ncbi:MAG: hypothetical protein CMC08_06680 [Flavobacteriaceae bacterium]|nr:hypothetical protein [Flavobacteriaceae bacterium]
MLQKLLVTFSLALCLCSCQFTETLVLQENGSGELSIKVDMKEMMSFGMQLDTTTVKMDTTVAMRQFLAEKRDSIAQLPDEEQQKLQAMENYTVHLVMDSDAPEMFFTVSNAFRSISEANDLQNSLDVAMAALPQDPNSNAQVSADPDSDVIGVRYTFSDGNFMRDAYIKDQTGYQRQLDSLQQAEAFMTGMQYTLKYTFPRRIKSTNITDATVSLDGKTLQVERLFVEYFKNPDILDVEVQLEK